MEKLKVSISWSGNNYCAESHDDVLKGIVVCTQKTLKGVKDGFQSSLQFHIKSCLQDGDQLPEWLILGQYELDYMLETSALLHSLDGILTRSAIARMSGINERQMGHYAAGIRMPRPVQRTKIVNAIHKISQELSTVR